ncbi:MAG TPA: glycine oxidase ThiO [Thermoanaerobaculia bacterium]|nr:glycine oxidase ThiO [Thermoanaerobaculia bacterium]
MSAGRADVAIVGGGLIGCAVAAELARRGRSVVVIERAEPGSEASGAAAGMLTPQSDAHARDAFFELALESHSLYPSWLRDLSEETELDVGYRRWGQLRCRFAGEPGPGLAERYDWQRASGLAVLGAPCPELADRIGGRLSPDVCDAVYFPDEAAVDPRALTRAAWRTAIRRGVEVRIGVRVVGFRIERGSCRGVDTDAGAVEADATVDAAGAWAAFSGQLPLPLPVAPVRGQIVRLALDDPLPTIVASDDVYLVPRGDGTALVGSTVEHAGFHKAVTAEGVERLLGAARRLVPDLASGQFVDAWSGLRPATPDGWPVLGSSPIRGLFFAAGHYRNGILLAPATASLVADEICGTASRDLTAFSIERFSPARRIA